MGWFIKSKFIWVLSRDLKIIVILLEFEKHILYNAGNIKKYPPRLSDKMLMLYHKIRNKTELKKEKQVFNSHSNIW